MTEEEKNKYYEKGKKYLDVLLNKNKLKQILKKTRVQSKLTSKQDFLNNYINELIEFETTYKRLQRFTIFISSFHFAYEIKGVSRISQFIYHIENYLAEIYIFEQRAKKLKGFIEKLAKKYKCPQDEIKFLIKAKKQLSESISPLTEIRSNHTHQANFSDGGNIDEMKKYDKAGDFTNDLKQKEIFKKSAENILSEQRKKWKKDITNDLNNCRIQMGFLYTALDGLIWQIYKKIK